MLDKKFTLTITKKFEESKKFKEDPLGHLSKHKKLKFLSEYIKNKINAFGKT